jgi:hypothetical protein
MSKKYATFKEFGSALNPNIKNPLNASNPLTYCLVPSLNSQFVHGSSSAGMLYSNQNASCMAFMSGRCMKEWDGYCQAYVDLNQDTYWPNMGVIDVAAYNNAKNYYNVKPTIGQDLLRNTCYRKFIFVPGQKPNYTQFDSNVANSPFIEIYNNEVAVYSFVKDLGNAKLIDSDPLVQKMLENPLVCMDVIGRIYLAYKNKENGIENQIKDSIIEKYFKLNEKALDAFVGQAQTMVPSFQYYNNLYGWTS